MILETLVDAFQGELETELFDALEDTFNGPGGLTVRQSCSRVCTLPCQTR